MASAGVGYRKPPKRTQFPKGVSGNPAGRPAGRCNLATVLEETLNEFVVVTERGEKKTVTKMEAAVKRMVRKAISGNTHAFRVLSALVLSSEESATGLTTSELAESDQKILQSLARRFGK
ncbi:MAG: DUF5681 domain-containing protein [Terriglobales bacterium]